MKTTKIEIFPNLILLNVFLTSTPEPRCELLMYGGSMESWEKVHGKKK